MQNLLHARQLHAAVDVAPPRCPANHLRMAGRSLFLTSSPSVQGGQNSAAGFGNRRMFDEKGVPDQVRLL